MLFLFFLTNREHAPCIGKSTSNNPKLHNIQPFLSETFVMSHLKKSTQSGRLKSLEPAVDMDPNQTQRLQ